MTTIYDIARAVGCSPSTVSKYITKHGYVSEALGKRIASTMTKLDYHYNGVARALSTSTNHQIGVMVPFMDHPYFQGLVNAICIAAAKENKEVTIFTTEFTPAKEQQCIQALAHRLIGSLIITSHTLPCQQIIAASAGRPVVFCENITDPAVTAVAIDRTTALTALFQSFQKRGKDSIGCLFIRRAEESVTTAETLAAYQQVFGHPLKPSLVRYHCWTFEEGQRAGQSLLNTNPHLQAILTESDVTAAGVAKLVGSPVVIGQGNQLLSRLLNFSSIDQHLDLIGQQAVALTSRDEQPTKEKVKFDLIWRRND